MGSTLKVQNIAHTGGTTALTIDSTGRVLKPVIPYGQASCNVAIASVNKVQLTSNIITGGGLTVDQTNERMIVPVSGLYRLGFTHLVDGGITANTTVNIRRNGTVIQGSHGQTTANSEYGHLSTNIIQVLSANDYIEWFCIAGQTHNNANYNNMYVYLLG